MPRKLRHTVNEEIYTRLCLFIMFKSSIIYSASPVLYGEQYIYIYLFIYRLQTPVMEAYHSARRFLREVSVILARL